MTCYFHKDCVEGCNICSREGRNGKAICDFRFKDMFDNVQTLTRGDGGRDELSALVEEDVEQVVEVEFEI